MSSKSFAQKQLSKHGWEEGQGLGKQNHGIKDAIKVKVKNNKGGLGHNQGSDFTFHWWDHIFNKAANSIEVTSDGDDVQIKKSTSKKKIVPVLISNKKPLHSSFNGKPLLYGCFVKAGSYNPSDKLQNKDISDSSSSDEDSSDDDDEDKKYFGSDTLEKTFKMTGLTGHKAARHGHKMSGKLQRIQDQEKVPSNTPNVEKIESKTEKRKKRQKKEGTNNEKDIPLEVNNDIEHVQEIKKKKKNKRKKEVEVLETDESSTKKKKRKKKSEEM